MLLLNLLALNNLKSLRFLNLALLVAPPAVIIEAANPGLPLTFNTALVWNCLTLLELPLSHG